MPLLARSLLKIKRQFFTR